MKTKNLFWLSAALLMAACTNEEDVSMVSSSAIQFNAAISESRVMNDAWEVGDEIGISMSAGTSMTNNVLYTAQDASGTFQTTGTALRFPDDSQSDVTFYAYYPYSSTLAEDKTLTFEVDGKTDVLWTSQVVYGPDQTSNKVQLSFSHALSKVILETEDFPDDIEVTLSEGYSQATLDITTGTVAGSTAEEGYSINLVKGEDGNYSAIVLPCESTTKTLTIASVSEDKQWTYTIASATYVGGHRYAYKATYRNAAGVQFTENGINGWEGDAASPSDLGQGTESVRPKGIADLLNGKTYTPDTDYYYDQVQSNGGGGWINSNGNTFGDNFETDWRWNADLKAKCENSSITFHYAEGRLTADAVDNGTAKTGIEVTVDESGKTLTFSQAPFTFHSHFTNNWLGGYVQGGENPNPGQEGTVWLLFAQKTDYTYGSFALGTDVDDVNELFSNGMHWAYSMGWTDSDTMNYVVLNFVEKTTTSSAEE